MRETAERKRAYWTPIIGANYPQTFAFPDTTVVDGQQLSIDGIELRINDLGAAECSDNIMIALPQIDAVIISDLVYNRVHPWIAEGRSRQWLLALDDAKGRLAGASTLYAGHGEIGSDAIIEEQASYITLMRELVSEALDSDGRLSASGKAAISARITAFYPNWPLAMIVDMNIDGVAAEISAG